MDAERHNVWAAAALAVLAALYLMLFRPGYSVMGGGDFALYLAHAQAIADFRPYAATGFVFNPANAIMSPAAYPPGLPLLLASLLAMLWGLHRLALPTLGPRWSAVLVLAAGLSPAILMRRDAIGSDMPFAAWCMLALVGARGRPALLAIGVAMAILTRSIGIVLATAIALDLVFRPGPARRRLLPALVAGTAVAVVGMLRPARHLDPVPPGLSHRGEMAAWRRSGDARPAGRGIPGHLRKPSLPPARYSRRSTRSLRNLDIPLARKSRRSASSSYSSRTQSRNATRPSPSAW